MSKLLSQVGAVQLCCMSDLRCRKTLDVGKH